MEWLNDGQHVEHYRVEAWDGAHWKAVVEGHAIGHKRIDSFEPVTASRIRLNILSSSAAAEIREFQVFNIGSALDPRHRRGKPDKGPQHKCCGNCLCGDCCDQARVFCI
jgi:alpha-L-fucosidase